MLERYNHPKAMAALEIHLLKILLLTFLIVPSSSAIVVTTTVDENGENSSACGLREAVRAINSESSFGGCTFTPGDTLVELGPETYELSRNVGVSDRVQISKPMTIRGDGPTVTILERTGIFDDDMLFVIVTDPGTVTLEGFTMRGSTGRFNSAIDLLARTGVDFVLRDMVFRDNVNEIGAALRIQGDASSPLLLERVVFEDNRNEGSFPEGGGLDCSASETSSVPSLHLVDVIFRNNVVSGDSALGGGMYSIGCDLELERVTFEGNAAISEDGSPFGGGLAVVGGDVGNNVTLTNVTFFGNSAASGGAFAQAEDGPGALSVTLSNVTFAESSAAVAGDHFVQVAGSTSLRNVLFGPTTGDGCGGASVITLLGGNIDSDGTCGVESTQADPGLSVALAPHGGFTPVLALVPGSVAIDAGTNTGCPASDQRGVTRPFDGDGDEVAVCDVGAFEASDIDIFADGFETGDTSQWSSAVTVP